MVPFLAAACPHGWAGDCITVRPMRTGAHLNGGARLEDLTPGTSVRGVTADGAVTVVAVRWHGSTAVTLTYRDGAGKVDERLVYRNDEPSLLVAEQDRAWGFDADGHLFRLVSEARRIRMAYLFDPMLAVHLSQLEALPHQIQAVYGAMLPRLPLRFLLADDPGAGKTIMAGLYIKELALRGDLARCLVVAPGGLVAQWQDELAEKFDLRFDILTRDQIEASQTQNPFAERNMLIARLDHLSRNEDLQAKLAGTDWDLVVVDEAHRMAAHWFGNEVKETKRYRLGQLLGSISRHFLLMTATPHAGKEEDFQLFLALLDADRFEGRFRDGAQRVDVSDLMRRMVKERLLRFDGRPLFPERVAYTVPYPLSDLEADLYAQVTDYVVTEMNRAQALSEAGEGRRGNRVGFALAILQRRLASSPEAIYRSLSRRRERLEGELDELRARARGQQHLQGQREAQLLADLDRDDDPESYDDLDDAELEDLEEELVDGASAAKTIAELDSEILTLRRLEALARQLRNAGTDRKWAEFAALLDDTPEMHQVDGSRRKLIVFTEHRDTLTYLVGRLRDRLGRPDAVVTIHGGTKREDRRVIQETFTQDPTCLILVATDAAGEGINLQRAHLLVNYDLPWNPNRIEQRFGRVHRIGQTEVCHMWNLVAEDTREGQVYLTLLHKLDEQRKALGGQVFDVLGDAFRGMPLRDLLIRAIRYGDRPDVRAHLDEVIDERVGEGLVDLVAEHALSADILSQADVARIRTDLEEAQARRLQPHYIRAFFLEAFRLLGGRLSEREPGRYQITHVIANVRAQQRQVSLGTAVLPRYERICFDKPLLRPPGKTPAELIAPGHPLLDATLDLLLERHQRLLEQGAILVDDTDLGDQPRLLVYLEHAVADGRTDHKTAPRVVSRRFEFVELRDDGTSAACGAAPYLDYRPATEDEQAQIGKLLEQQWLATDVEAAALDVAIEQAVPDHLAEVRSHTISRVHKVRAAVHERLTHEIAYWDHRAVELDEQVGAGRQPRMNPDRARQRADELATRLRRRMGELDQEEQLKALPPVVAGAALIIPVGLLHADTATAIPPAHARDTTRIERAAVDAVLDTERALGRQPEEMSHNNPGFDIRSRTADDHLIFLEVKGRIAGADTVTITRNEILTGLNTERWVLALVEVDPAGATQVRYLRHPFRGQIDDLGFTETSRTFSWTPLWKAAGQPT
jgi:superfamily II DNA or RNA helicase